MKVQHREEISPKHNDSPHLNEEGEEEEMCHSGETSIFIQPSRVDETY